MGVRSTNEAAGVVATSGLAIDPVEYEQVRSSGAVVQAGVDCPANFNGMVEVLGKDSKLG